MKFTKMHGCGNDYVFIDLTHKDFTSEEYKEIAKMVVRISDRRSGIGADGCILIKSSKVADFDMEIYNADGTIAEMCGNGIRCVGKYVYDYGLTDKQTIQIGTKAGVKYLELLVKNSKVDSVRVNMGTPIVTPTLIPTIYQGDLDCLKDYRIQVAGLEYEITAISMGNPHAVIFMEDILHADVKYIGPLIEHHSFFPQRTNVEFAHVIDKDTIEMRVWERGTGETFACGTGSCASVVAAILHGYTNTKVHVQLLGGELLIEYDIDNNLVYMTGPAINVFDGETVDLLSNL